MEQRSRQCSLTYAERTQAGILYAAIRNTFSTFGAGLGLGVTYYYALVAVDSGQDDSAQSAVVEVTTP